MKKILLSLGFAAGTILCVNAQEVPPQEQPVPQEEQTFPQEETLPQEQPEMTQEAPDQQQGMESQEGITLITEEELPQEVKDGLANSEYSDATVEQAFELSGEAIPAQLIEQENAANPDVDSDQKFYQLQVNQENEPAILYFDEQGELIEAQTM